MFKILALLLLTIGAPALGDDVTDGTELLMTFLVHRHGDRTPTPSTISYSTDSETLEKLSAEYGYGQLTDEGKRTGYKLGEFIRKRYDELLSDKYNRSEIYIRSTDSTRTKMTVLSAMSAVYPTSDDNWSDTINWTPIPYATVPIKYDFNMAFLNCPVFTEFYYAKMITRLSSMDKYADLFAKWNNYLSFNISEYPVLAYIVYDVYATEISLGMTLPDEIETMLPDIAEAAGDGIDIIWGDDEYIKYQAGTLLNEFFNKTQTLIDGEDTPSVRIYSSHDFNVFSIESVSRVSPRQGVPKYGSAFALELRKVTATGNYVVLPVYLKDPKTGETLYLQVEGCDLLCDYDTFKSITSSYVMEEDTWRSDCGFSDDLVFDTSSVD